MQLQKNNEGKIRECISKFNPFILKVTIDGRVLILPHLFPPTVL